jgi:hypothetical protein
VPFLHLIMIAAMPPAVSNPPLARMFRTLPAAGSPDVVVAIVAVIASGPYITPLRRTAAVFVDAMRRADANRDLRKRSHRA